MKKFFSNLKKIFIPHEPISNDDFIPTPSPDFPSDPSPTRSPELYTKLTELFSPLAQYEELKPSAEIVLDCFSKNTLAPAVTQQFLKTLEQFISSKQQILETYHSQNMPESDTSSNTAEQYTKLIKEMQTLAPIDASITHENLPQSNVIPTVQTLSRYYNILEQLFNNPIFVDFDQSDFATFTLPFTQVTQQCSEIIAYYQKFKPAEETLRQEIETFSIAVEQIQKQTGNSIDWGGKKEAFEKKATELSQRRDAYNTQEVQFNQRLQAFATSLTILYKQFIPFLDKPLNHLSSLNLTNPTQNTALALQEEITLLFNIQEQFVSLLRL